MWYLISALVLIMILLLLIAPVTVHISYELDERDDLVPNTTLNLATPGTGVSMSFLWGLFKLRLRLSSIRLVFGKFAPIFKMRARLAKRSGDVIDEESTIISAIRVIDLLKQMMNIYRATKPAFLYLLSKIKLHQFSWCTRLGMYEADQTGLAVGLLWALKSNSTAYIYSRLSKPKPKPRLEIIPVFDTRALTIHLNCVFSLRPGQVLLSGIMTVWFYLINRKKIFMHNQG